MRVLEELGQLKEATSYEVLLVNIFTGRVRHSGVTQLKIGDICLLYVCGCMHVILYFDPCNFVFACGLPLPIPPLNRIIRFSDPVSFKEI